MRIFYYTAYLEIETAPESALLTKYYSDDQIKKNGMTGGRRGAYSVLAGNLRDGDHLEHVGVDGRIILTCLQQMALGRVLMWLKAWASGGLL
jgi:hypothetical protein